LAAIRLAALAALPLAAVADRVGRRRALLTWVTVGLLTVVAAAASPGYWWFVAAFALARPLLTATDTVGEVMAAELTGAEDRAKAVALMSAAYGVGAGGVRSEEHTSELQSRENLVCRLQLEKKKHAENP